MILKAFIICGLVALAGVPLLCSAGHPVHHEHCDGEDPERCEDQCCHDSCEDAFALLPSSVRAQRIAGIAVPVSLKSQASEAVTARDPELRNAPDPPGPKLPYPPSDLPQLV